MKTANLSVVSRRSEPSDSLDYFPTPPWATRALLEHVIPGLGLGTLTVREPCCGEGHMAAVLAETFADVMASDVFDYGFGDVEDYLAIGRIARPCDWVITNPPFNRAADVLAVALSEARYGVALLLRSVWMHGASRYATIFDRTPPGVVAPFAERVSMLKGRWVPDASTATDYCWFVWFKSARPMDTRVRWIPPGRRRALTQVDDYKRFAAMNKAPLFADEGGAA